MWPHGHTCLNSHFDDDLFNVQGSFFDDVNTNRFFFCFFIHLFLCLFLFVRSLLLFLCVCVFFYGNAIIREIEACAHLLASLCSCLEQLLIIRENSEYGSLFPKGDHKAIGLFNTSAAVNQYCFYGRCIGFHVSILSHHNFYHSQKCSRNSIPKV